MIETANISKKKSINIIKYGDNQITFSGDFDSGNFNSAVYDFQTRVWNNNIDQVNTNREIKPSNKCWFHFWMKSPAPYLQVKLKLCKVNSLNIVSKIYDLYRPVVKVQDSTHWQRHHCPVEFEVTTENEINLRMDVQLLNNKKLYIALCYPWSYTDNQDYLSTLQKKLKGRKDVYFNKETLIRSPEGRNIRLLAITSGEVHKTAVQDYIENLFPQRNCEVHYGRINKPIILITARVHPGQIGSSYALIGMIDFLLSGTDEAHKILQQFYFLIVPMLNPDGVALGHNRLDALGQNLNRFYHFPDFQKQPSCYAIKSLVQNSRKQIYAFFDLHGHANKKSCFLFGNSISFTRMQIESVVYAKYLASICEYMEFKSCNFSKKEMSSKDKNEGLSKQGCARVVVHRWTNSPYCYTLETGLYKNVKVDQKGIQRYGDKFYDPIIYSQVGAKMIISLFRILKKSKQIDEMRKSATKYVTKLEKINSTKKIKKIATLKQSKQKIQDQILSLQQLKKQRNINEGKHRQIERILHLNKNEILNMFGSDD